MLTVTLTDPGTYYFACQVSLCCACSLQPVLVYVQSSFTIKASLLLQVGDHCIEDGQKLVVTVTNSTAGTVDGFTTSTA